MNVIPVERGGNDMSALREVIKKIREGNGVVLFPEGTRSKDGNLQPARAGIGLVISKTLAPVVPMRIFGAYHAFPKGFAALCASRKLRCVIGEPLFFTARGGDAREPGDRPTPRRSRDGGHRRDQESTDKGFAGRRIGGAAAAHPVVSGQCLEALCQPPSGLLAEYASSP